MAGSVGNYLASTTAAIALDGEAAAACVSILHLGNDVTTSESAASGATRAETDAPLNLSRVNRSSYRSCMAKTRSRPAWDRTYNPTAPEHLIVEQAFFELRQH